MKFFNLSRSTKLATFALLAGSILSVSAADKPATSQRLFASPDDAIKALQAAAQNNDGAGLRQIFGPEFKNILTGDKVQDANNEKKFAAAMAEGVKPVNEGDDKITLEIGTNGWPMPIPLVKAAGQWYFDTIAGKEEVINRHIGKDELHAIGVLRAYVTAQKQYASENGGTYASNFKSLTNNAAGSFLPLVEEAREEGYGSSKGTGLHAFHGYYFRFLTCQGSDAPGGKKDYTTDKKLTGGFALVAYPEHWDKSGIMTFIVNQDGKVYQRNFGEKTAHMGKKLKEYNPDTDWKLEEDEGVSPSAMQP